MSIATLKKKTSARYNHSHISSNNGAVLNGTRSQGSFLTGAGFSLNGTHRSQGYVGQDTLGRSLPKTPMKGNVIKGHGGCCGSYPIQPIVQSAVTSLNNPNVVKTSVLNNNGMLMTQYRWIRRPAPFVVVKPDNTLNANTQQDYVERLKQNTISSANNSDCQKYKYTPASCKNILNNVNVIANYRNNVNEQINQSNCAGTIISNRRNHVIENKNVCNITKDLENVKVNSIPMSEGEYLLKLDNECAVNNDYKFTHKTNGAPFPGFI